MKILWICCNESIGDELVEILDSDGLRGYSVIQRVLGKDEAGGRVHWGNAVFPGMDWIFMISGEDAAVSKILERVRTFSEIPYVARAGLKAFLHEAEEVI